MKTQLLALALLAGSSLLFGAGCNIPLGFGCDSAPSSNFQEVNAASSNVTATRTSISSCGTAYSSGDTLSLDIEADQSWTMTLDISMSAPVGEAVPLLITTPTPMTFDGSSSPPPPLVQTASDSQSLVKFSMSSSSEATAIDTSPINSMLVTIASLPSTDGDMLSVEITINFLDGNTFGQSFEATTTTSDSARAPSCIK